VLNDITKGKQGNDKYWIAEVDRRKQILGM
jgi:hypothetical protein